MARCKLLCVEKREEWEFLNRRLSFVVFFAVHPGAIPTVTMTFPEEGYRDFTPGQYYEFESGLTEPDEETPKL